MLRHSGIVRARRIDNNRFVKGVLSEGDYPFMFISPSDTEEFINFQKSVLIMTFSLTPPPEEKSPSTPFPRIWDDNESVSVSGSSSVGQLYGRYQDLLDANPYRNLSYNQSGWQKMLSSLGFRTGYDDFREQAEINAREYDASIMSMVQQNEYNSPAEQASRMREAGLNPDLQGLGDVADAAKPADDPNGMPSQSSAEAEKAWSAFQSFGQLVVSSMTAGMSLYKEFIGIDLLKGQITEQGLINEGRDLENNKAIGSIIDSMILENIGGLDQHSENGSAVVDTIQGLVDIASDDARYGEYAGLLAGYGLSPKMIKAMRPRVAKRAQSILSDENIFNEFAKRNSALASMKQSQSSEFYSESAWQDAVLDAHVRVLRDGQRKLSEITQRVSHKLQSNQETAASIEGSRLDVLDANEYGSLVAQNELNELLSNTYSIQFAKVLNEVKQDLVNELQVLADTGNSMARAELYYMALHDFVNFDFSASLNAGFKGVFGNFLPFFNASAEAQVHLK